MIDVLRRFWDYQKRSTGSSSCPASSIFVVHSPSFTMSPSLRLQPPVPAFHLLRCSTFSGIPAISSTAVKKGSLSTGDVGVQYKYRDAFIDVKLDTDSNVLATITLFDAIPSTKTIASLKYLDYNHLFRRSTCSGVPPSPAFQWIEELERELRVIEEEYERSKRIWNPWGVYEPMLDPQEFASLMRDIEAQEEYERTLTIDPWEIYDSEDEEKGYAGYETPYWDDDLCRYISASEYFWEDDPCI